VKEVRIENDDFRVTQVRETGGQLPCSQTAHDEAVLAWVKSASRRARVGG